ncbi:MAG: triose-phosphate isomerase [Candidatus Magasanikbacteria bacterium]|nr:triose-phosphate isomerase [Candidatus Magasanikbacteria bacterium]
MQKIIVANWKMVVKKEQLVSLVEVVGQADKTNLEVALCPSFVHLTEVASLINNKNIGLGAQNCFWVEHGAYTGEVSAWDLKDEGCQYVLVGHSERRKYFSESDEIINKKLLAVLEVGLTPILCVGETKEEKDAGHTLERVREQLQKDLVNVILKDSRIIIAYEPVWAIGTGDFCKPNDAEEVQSMIKEEFTKITGVAEVAVLYGGSVDDKNVAEFLKQNSIDGVLVGGASTKVEVLGKLLANSI